MNDLQIKQRTDQFQFFGNYLQNIPGNIVECGVGNGNTLAILCQVFPDRQIIGIDSFNGFPKNSITEYDNEFSKNRVKTINNRDKSYHSLEHVSEKVLQHHNDVKFIKGYFEDILPQQYSFGPIALLHLDCDIYSSYRAAFSLYPQVVTNGIIAFDEYNSKWTGATKAIDKFLEEHGLKIHCYKVSEYIKYYTFR